MPGFPPLLAENVDIAAVVDLNPERAKAQVAKYGIETKVSDNLDDVLRRVKADFVVDLTIPEAHYAVTLRVRWRAGFHVIGEKPMASNMDEARRMVQTAEKTGRLYMVSQSRRWNPLHDRVRRTVTGGALGTLTTINCDFYLGAHFGGFRDEMDSPLILDMSIHHFDLARFMTGADPVAVYALEFNPAGSWYKGDVAASCIFEMSNGVVFTYRGSWCAEGCHTSWNGRLGASSVTLARCFTITTRFRKGSLPPATPTFIVRWSTWRLQTSPLAARGHARRPARNAGVPAHRHDTADGMSRQHQIPRYGFRRHRKLPSG